MDPRALARTDQLRAVLREADRSVHTVELYQACSPPGRHTWGYIETCYLLFELHDRGILTTDGEPCCVNHAFWQLPADR